MLYPELFKQLEAVRWNMDLDIPWDQFDASRLSEGYAARFAFHRGGAANQLPQEQALSG